MSIIVMVHRFIRYLKERDSDYITALVFTHIWPLIVIKYTDRISIPFIIKKKLIDV